MPTARSRRGAGKERKNRAGPRGETNSDRTPRDAALPGPAALTSAPPTAAAALPRAVTRREGAGSGRTGRGPGTGRGGVCWRGGARGRAGRGLCGARVPVLGWSEASVGVVEDPREGSQGLVYVSSERSVYRVSGPIGRAPERLMYSV